MHATFFIARSEDAASVASVDDLPDGPIGDPLALPSPSLLGALAALLDREERCAVEPLRDATCRSFPVWMFAPRVTRAIAALADEALEAVAEAWLVELRAGGADVDPVELSTLLGDLRDGARAGDPTQDQLFALLEERVL